MNGQPVFEFQVAGRHSSSVSNLLRGEFGRVLKPYKVKAASPLRTYSPDLIRPNKEDPNTENDNFDHHGVVCPDERAFYELCVREGDRLHQLRDFLPAFYGETTVCTDGRPTRYLVLEDLTARCGLPCVADLKMGVSRHYPGKPPLKLRADKEKYPSLRDTGWCIAGLLQHAPHGPLLDKFGPSTGRSFSTQQVHARLTEFIGGARGSAKRRQLVRKISADLEEIQKWFDSQRRFWFRNSSILVVYNAEYFLEAPMEKSEKYSDSRTDVRRNVSTTKDVSLTANAQSIDQTIPLDAVLTGRPCEGENDEADETLQPKKSVSDDSKLPVSSSCSTEINRSVDQASTSTKTSVSSKRDCGTSKLGGTNLQSMPSEDGSCPTDQAREAESSSVSGMIADSMVNPELNSTPGTIAEIVGNSASSYASSVLKNEVQRNSDLDELVDQRLQSMPKKMKLESPSDRSCLKNEQGETNLNSSPLIVRVKMIDFAHVLDAGGEPDSSYLTGLNNLLQFIQNIA